MAHGQFGRCYCYEFCAVSFPGGSITEVKTPPFAESITEGDVQWQKGVLSWLLMNILLNIVY